MPKINVKECPVEVVQQARKLYEAYTANSDNLNFRGEPCPPWDQLTEAVQSHWCAVEYATKASGGD